MYLSKMQKHTQTGVSVDLTSNRHVALTLNYKHLKDSTLATPLPRLPFRCVGKCQKSWICHGIY